MLWRFCGAQAVTLLLGPVLRVVGTCRLLAGSTVCMSRSAALIAACACQAPLALTLLAFDGLMFA